MLDCGGVNALRLRRPEHDHTDLVLTPGVHAVGRDASGQLALVGIGQPMLAQLCIDRRGIWMQLAAGTRGIHVNGRPVKRMAMLRAGDSVFVEGTELHLLGAEPLPAPDADPPGPFEDGGSADARRVLRGVGGALHGRCYRLDRPATVGRARDCDVRIDEPGLAERHARLVPHADGLVLRDLGSEQGSHVNGHAVRHALLQAGDQLVIDGCRFVVEAPRTAAAGPKDLGPHDSVTDEAGPTPVRTGAGSVRRLPWLLLAALLLSGALSLLLLYGTR